MSATVKVTEEDTSARTSAAVAGAARDAALVQGIKRGTRVWFARGVATRIVSLSTNLLLVALVAPRQLGLLATVRGLVGVLHFATDLGLESALVRRHLDPNVAELAALSGVRMLLLGVIAAAVAFVPGASSLFGTIDAGLGPWMVLLAVVLCITPAQLGSKVLLERDLQFKALGTLEVATVLFENVLLVVAALLGFFERGVFITFALSFVFVTVITQRMAPMKRLSLDIAALRPMLRDTAGFSAAALFTVMRTSLTPILLARLFGLSVAGNWALAERLSSSLNLVFESFVRTAFAGAARLRHSAAHLREITTHALDETASWVLPASVAIFVAFPVLGAVLPKWSGAVAPGQAYVLVLGVAGTITAALGPATQAMRGPAFALLEQAVGCIALWAALAVIALAGGVNIGAAFAVGVAAQAVTLLVVCTPSVRPAIWSVLRRPLLIEVIIVSLFLASGVLGASVMWQLAVGIAALLAWQAPHVLSRLATPAAPTGSIVQ